MVQPAQNPQQNRPRQVRVEIPAKLDATYSNAVVVSQTHSEIIMDFAQILPNNPQARIQARVVMTAANAKAFLNALQHNINNFEDKHGEIDMPLRPQTLADQLFNAVKPEDDDNDDQ